MSLYGTEQVLSVEEIANSNSFLEMLLVDDILKGSDEQRKAFCESTEAQILMEKAVLRKPTLIRLSKQDDMKKRVKLAAYQIAKAAGSSDYEKLKKYTKARKIVIEKIMKKYGSKAAKVAAAGQKNYIKLASAGSTSTEDKKA